MSKLDNIEMINKGFDSDGFTHKVSKIQVDESLDFENNKVF